MKARNWLTAVGSGLLIVLLAPGITLGDVIPTDGMIITENTTFVPGTYNLPNGVSIGASGVTLNMNGATLVGSDFNNYGVTCIGHNNVTIANGVVHGYYYGVRIETGTAVAVLNCDLSGNWVDPASQGSNPPWLNINVGPNLGDRTNLGGGLFMKSVTGATVWGNILRNQENGMDLYWVHNSTISGNDASQNTGWGIHLYGSTGNLVTSNTCNDCIRANLGDSAGMLLVYGSDGNHILNNSFQRGGDGFFIGNEWGCPSNNNVVQGNNGSYAGANAFEATFSSGNQFIANTASFSNYGFWLGYSHDGNVIRGNIIRANNTNGIEIEHGQNNTIESNEIIGNGGRGIVLRTDGQVHFPPAQFPCLNLPAQQFSRGYTIRDNIIHSNFGLALDLAQTTDSTIVNNLIGGQFGGTAHSDGANNVWSIDPTPGTNIVGGPTLGGNWWSNYTGADNDGDGLGDTELPYTNGGQIAAPGDPHPLIGNPDIAELENPRTLYGRIWVDLGRNTRANGQTFDTSNGAHFATDGTELLLLEGSNSTRLSRFNPATGRYEPKATVPEAVWDGGDFQFGDGRYFATVGVQFNAGDGSGKGSFLYRYDPVMNTWSQAARTFIGGRYYCNEALAYDPANARLYATITAYQTGGDTNATKKLAIYNPATNSWTGFTAASPDTWNPGSEAEYLDGKIYVWRGGFAGGAVTGSDSYLNVYDIATNSWTTTPTLQSAGVIPGFRSGGFDVWGVSLTADPVRAKLYVTGAEANRQLYVFDVATQSWAVGPTAIYDGGWGASAEFVPAADELYQIDGRSALGNPQGTAVLVWGGGDTNCDGVLDFDDINPFVLALSDPAAYQAQYPGCNYLTADCNGDGGVDFDDINPFVEFLSGN